MVYIAFISMHGYNERSYLQIVEHCSTASRSSLNFFHYVVYRHNSNIADDYNPLYVSPSFYDIFFVFNDVNLSYFFMTADRSINCCIAVVNIDQVRLYLIEYQGRGSLQLRSIV